MEPKKKLLFTPRFLLPMGAVLLLFGGFLFYYFKIVSRQEASLDERAFRSLAAVSSQLRDLVSKYSEVMHRSTEKEKFKAFVAEQVPDLLIDDHCLKPETGPSVRPVLREDGYALQFIDSDSKVCAHVRLDTAVAPLLGG